MQHECASRSKRFGSFKRHHFDRLDLACTTSNSAGRARRERMARLSRTCAMMSTYIVSRSSLSFGCPPTPRPYPAPSSPLCTPFLVGAVKDYIQQLVGLSRANLDKDDSTMLSSGRVVLKVTLFLDLGACEASKAARAGWDLWTSVTLDYFGVITRCGLWLCCDTTACAPSAACFTRFCDDAHCCVVRNLSRSQD